METQQSAPPDRAERVLRSAAGAIAGPLGALGSISTVAMMIGITADVISRNFFGQSIAGLLEFTETLLVTTVFLGLAYAGATNAHVSVDLLSSKLPNGVSRRMGGAMWLLGAAMTVWFIDACWQRAVQSTQRGEVTQGLMEWPVYPARWIIVIGLIAFLVIALINAYLGLRGRLLLGEDEWDPTTGDPRPETAAVPTIEDDAAGVAAASGAERTERNA